MIRGELKQRVKAYLLENPSASSVEIHKNCGGSYSAAAAAAANFRKELGIKSSNKFEERRELILEKLSNGATQKEVAEEFGIKQSNVSLIQKKAAIRHGVTKQETIEKPESISKETGTRAFIYKAWSSHDDAKEAWRDVGKTELEVELAIDAADMAAAAWKDAALKIRNRR